MGLDRTRRKECVAHRTREGGSHVDAGILRSVTSPATTALIVTYNHARYVADAIESILAQSVSVDEIVIVDDGSTDDTVARARAFDDPRIRVLAEAHRGITRLAETYNAGLAVARGDLIAICEGDDRWPARKLALQVPPFADPDVVVSHGAYGVIGAKGTVLRPEVQAMAPDRPGPYDALGPHLLMSYVMAVTAVIRRATLLAVGGFQALGDTVHWDYPTFLALAERGRFWYTREIVGLWRKHGASGTMALAGRDLAGVDLSVPLALAARQRHAGRPGLPEPRAIEQAWSDAFARQMWHAGRVLLLGRRYAGARRVASLALARGPSLGLRIRVIAVWLAALVRTDLERFSFLSGRRSSIEELT